LIAGGHTFGKAHGAVKEECLGVDPAASNVEKQGIGWDNKCGKGKGVDTFTSGLEGAWTASPVKWTNMYLANLYAFEWELTTSPAGKKQWKPKNGEAADTVPDAHDPNKKHAPMMLTTDLALKMDPAYGKITKGWLENPKAFEKAFARAWFKLTHRDMGPRVRYVGDEVPTEVFLWQDPLPPVDHPLVDADDQAGLKEKILATGLSVPELVRVAWASASTFRGSDMRGGANGARIRLAPQKDWDVNNPKEVSKVIGELEKVQKAFNDAAAADKKVSLADLIVLAGNAAVEKAAQDAGYEVKVPFTPGRADATPEQTDAKSFAWLEPTADGFRNYYKSSYLESPARAMVDRADLLELTVEEMTVLVGGLRALDANANGVKHGVLTKKPGRLTNDFFVNLLDMTTKWQPAKEEGVFEGRDAKSKEVKWTATEADLVFGSNSELRAVVEGYSYDGMEEQFVKDFVAAWTKVMDLDRFDVERPAS
ncbi:MAG: peroxidase family protein, partial [Myxococcota bacterium]